MNKKILETIQAILLISGILQVAAAAAGYVDMMVMDTTEAVIRAMVGIAFLIIAVIISTELKAQEERERWKMNRNCLMDYYSSSTRRTEGKNWNASYTLLHHRESESNSNSGEIRTDMFTSRTTMD